RAPSRGVRQRAPRRRVDVSLARTRRAGPGNGAADQDDRRALFRGRSGDSGAVGIRTPGSRRGPNRARTAGLSRLGRGVGQTGRRMSTSILRSLSTVAAGLVAAMLWLAPAAAQSPLRPELAYPYEVSADDDPPRRRFDILDGRDLHRSKF